jgi:hypothetical protein
MHFQLNNFLKKRGWVERFVHLKEEKKAEFKEQSVDIKILNKIKLLLFQKNKKLLNTHQGHLNI